MKKTWILIRIECFDSVLKNSNKLTTNGCPNTSTQYILRFTNLYIAIKTYLEEKSIFVGLLFLENKTKKGPVMPV